MNIDDAHLSYVRNCSIWQSYNRAITMNMVNQLTVENNVIYNIMGHAVFFENAFEINNNIVDNLIIDVR
jgi:hypothetical protein